VRTFVEGVAMRTNFASKCVVDYDRQFVEQLIHHAAIAPFNGTRCWHFLGTAIHAPSGSAGRTWTF
jgi:hypothetical protein